ncbi:NDR1/HIN1-like protein 12 [Mercurialis annua]|uniref:NDR1/HIN1-like protein 12 n=1 Tax=Mercurialis annua TaxID=3986 RepID=UPI00215FAA48|nr:NDR1/HIN1-like protein 12 [Mercurialis annua]
MASDPSSYSRPPVTGYPQSQHQNGYPPPPATVYPPPYYYHNQPQPFYPNPRTTLLRRMVAAILVATVLFFTIFFICWLVLRPHRPQFRITSFSLSNFNLSHPQRLTADWNARFQVYNPNKKLKISYDQIVCSLLYRTEILSQTRVPPLYQDTKNLSFFDASFSALDTYVDDWVVKGINEDRSQRQAVSFNLRLAADVGFKVGSFRARRRYLRVLCDGVTVAISSGSTASANFTGASRECKVYA